MSKALNGKRKKDSLVIPQFAIENWKWSLKSMIYLYLYNSIYIYIILYVYIYIYIIYIYIFYYTTYIYIYSFIFFKAWFSLIFHAVTLRRRMKLGRSFFSLEDRPFFFDQESPPQEEPVVLNSVGLGSSWNTFEKQLILEMCLGNAILVDFEHPSRVWEGTWCIPPFLLAFWEGRTS